MGVVAIEADTETCPARNVMTASDEGQKRINESRSLIRHTSVVSTMTLLSRITGLARDIGFSRWFGAGALMDAFFVAFKIPNLLRRFFAEGAFSAAFVPIISEYRTTRGLEETKELVDRVAGTLGLVLFAITVAGVVAAPILIMIFAPGFLDDDGRYELARDMLRLTFPYLFFISLTALAGAILNAYRSFAVPAFTPVLLNIVLIGFAGWIAPHMENPGLGLAAGVFVAGLVQLLFQLPFLLRLQLLPLPRWGWGYVGVRRVLKLMAPVIFGSSVAQINILFDTLIASFLAAGSISWLYYSDRLMEFPLGVFGIALATVILPTLSEQHVTASKEAFTATLDWALRLVLLIAFPAALGLIVLAEPLLITIFHGGEFTAFDVSMAAASLVAYALGLVGFILVKVLTPGYFARQDTKTPVRIGVFSLLLNMFLNVVLVISLVRVGFYAPHAGLALATTLSALFNAALLLRGLRKSDVYRPQPGWRRLIGQVLVASAVMTCSIFLALDRLGDWIQFGIFERISALVICVLIGLGVYFGTCFLLGLRVRSFQKIPMANL
ncbi:MAG: murein biosynthesis integral membrane protein MurJ [Pseudomonadota bacterium]|nr:murein biosynthesis integral membrane protein MurJ [Pseudomonadota bacterium]